MFLENGKLNKALKCKTVFITLIFLTQHRISNAIKTKLYSIGFKFLVNNIFNSVFFFFFYMKMDV